MKRLFNYILRMRRWKQVMLVLMLWCIQGLVDVNNFAKAPLRDAANFQPYQDSAGMVARLSDEQSMPLKLYGETIAQHDTIKGHNVQHSYYEPVELFPTVLDCLQKSEWQKPQPDLTKIDWNKIDNGEEADVCLFRIASSYEKPDDMKQWFEVNGFDGIRILLNSSHLENVSNNWAQSIGGKWDFKQKGFLFYPNFAIKLLQELTVYSCHCGLGYDVNGNVMRTYCSMNSL